MRIATLILTVFVALAFVGTAFAVPAGKTVEFKDGAMGKVMFDGKVHADKGLKCNDCHTKLFPMKKTELKMATMNEGKECGACHNGEKAFSVKDAKDCAKCHKK